MKIKKRFAIASNLVTVEELRRFYAEFSEKYSEKKLVDFEKDMKSLKADNNEQPIIGVSWFQAAEYCNWLSRNEGTTEDQLCYEVVLLPKTDETGKTLVIATLQPKKDYFDRAGYRLPTEVEWEYAARAGAVTSRFFGQTKELMEEYAWVQENSEDTPQKVGRKKPNDFGLFDMLGNQWEWCQGPYSKLGPEWNANEILLEADDPDLNKEIIDDDAKEMGEGVLRGGAHETRAMHLRVSSRYHQMRKAEKALFGFRVARYLP